MRFLSTRCEAETRSADCFLNRITSESRCGFNSSLAAPNPCVAGPEGECPWPRTVGGIRTD